VFLPEEYRKRLEVLGNLTIFENMPSSIDEFTKGCGYGKAEYAGSSPARDR